ncbi:MAG: hypothetical protein M0D55_16445 [Elusimicrobiota bacterium]|nr:MAG: hypothetical protein M0D55_16445 [Elusimicrobiota bacterium]
MPDLGLIEAHAKDAVAAAIKADPMAGASKTVPVMCQRISAAAIENPQPKDAIVAAVRGSMQAVLLAGQNLPDAAIGLLDALPNMSLMMRAGPEELMSWVMGGVAEATKVAPPDVRDAVRARIEEKYMGASSIFDELCRAADANR